MAAATADSPDEVDISTFIDVRPPPKILGEAELEDGTVVEIIKVRGFAIKTKARQWLGVEHLSSLGRRRFLEMRQC